MGVFVEKDDLIDQLLMIARVGLSLALLMIVMVAGLVLSKKLIPDLNPFLVLVAAIGTAVASFIAFPQVVKRQRVTAAPPSKFAREDFSVAEKMVPIELEKLGISIDSVHFSGMPGLNLVEKDATWARWQTDEGDIVFLRFIPEPVQNPVPLSDTNGVREQYKEMVAQQGAAMIELDIVAYSGIPCMEMISKTRMKPHGMAYAASATLMWRDFSFNIAFHSPERGVTGFRDAIVADKFLAKYAGTEEFDAAFYDRSSNPEAAQRNRSDDECYDVDFPDHPLSRCRQFLRDLQTHIVIMPEVRNARPCPM